MMSSNNDNLILFNSSIDTDFIESNFLNANEEKNNKEPMNMSEGNIRKRFPFSKEEDNLLLSLVQFYGLQNKGVWNIIASHMKGRNVRQCRERYQLFLSQSVKKGEKWSAEEDQILLSKYEIYGPHWKKYEPFFVGRTSYSIKNRFKSLARPKHFVYNNNPDFLKSMHYTPIIKKQNISSSVSKLKIDSMISFSKDDDENEIINSTMSNLENADAYPIFADNYQQNEPLIYY